MQEQEALEPRPGKAVERLPKEAREHAEHTPGGVNEREEHQPGPCEGSAGRVESGHSHGSEHLGHSHGHAHRGRGHSDRARDRRRLLGTLALTVAMMIFEAVGGWLSGSLALLSDAGHMLTDAAALLLAVLALWFAGRPADLKRTYGFFRIEVLSALVNGVTLVGIAGLIGWEAWQRIAHPEHIKAGLMLAVAVVGLIINLIGMVLLARSGNLNVRAAFLHVVGDALSSVGVIAAGAIAWVTGSSLPDPLISIGIALIIAFGSLSLIREAVHVLLEAVPAHIDLVEVFSAMKEVRGVRQIHDLHVWTISHSLHALSAHLVCSGEPADRDEVLSSARAVLRDRFGIDHATLQIESEQFAQRHEPSL